MRLGTILIRIAACVFAALLMSACSGEIAISPAVTAPPARALAAQGSAPQGVGKSSAGQVRAEIVRWFSAAGYKDFQVEALVEHARIESGFAPCASPRSGLRYTFQWGGLRLRRLTEFAGARGGCPPLGKQLTFADNELRNEPAYSCFWRAATRSAALTALRRGFGGGSC